MNTPEFTPEKFPLAIVAISGFKKPFKYDYYRHKIVDNEGTAFMNFVMQPHASAYPKTADDFVKTKVELGEMICAFLNSLEITNP